MNTVLLWLGGLLVAVLCALFAIPHMIDWNSYRGAFEEEASRLLGRELRVAGPVSVRFLPTPYVSLDRVRLSDLPSSPGYGDGEPLLRADRFTMGLSITPLLRGSIEATEVELTRPELRLQIGTDGRFSLPLIAPVSPTQPGSENRFQLRALTVNGGRILVSGLDRRELLTVQDLTGDLAMPEGGPLRFKGGAAWGGEMREVRVSAAQAEPGAMRLRATAQSKTTGASYVFDGVATGLTDRPTLEGELTARLPAQIGSVALGTDKPAARKPPAAADAFELKAQITGNANELAMRDIALSFERDGQPQMIAGEALVDWRTGIDVRTSLNSKWLDLDRIADTAAGVAPMDAAAWLSRTVLSVVPEGGRFNGRIAVESVNLGGDVINAVTLAVTGGNGRINVDELRAGLPGGAVLELKGTPASSGRGLSGDMVLRATSAARLLNWAAKGSSLPQLSVDGPVLISGRISIEAKSVGLTAAHVEIAGQTLAGSMAVQWDPRPKFTLDIDAHRLDIAAILPGLLSPAGFAAFTGLDRPAPRAGFGPGELARWFNPETSDLQLKLRIGQLDDGQRRIRDVAGDIGMVDRELSINNLQVSTDAGGGLTVSGRAKPDNTDATGFLAFGLSADTPEAMSDLLLLFNAQTATKPDKSDLERLVPMRMAATLTRSAATDGRSELVVDGGLRATRAYINSNSNGPLNRLHTAPIDLYAAFVGPEAGDIGRLVLSLPRSESATAGGETADSLQIRMAGRADTQFLLNGNLQTANLDLGFSGTVDPKIPTVSGLKGRLEINRANLAQLVALAGRPIPAMILAADVVGGAEVDHVGGRTTAMLSGLRVGGSVVTGMVSLETKDGGPAFDVDATVDTLTLANLLSPLLQTAAPATGDTGAVSPWPDKAFNLETLRRSRGTLKLAVGTLSLDGETTLPSARINAVLQPGLLEIRDLSGHASGGRVATSWRVEPQTADVTVNGAIKLNGARLDAFDPAAKGEIGATITVSGRGIGLRSIAQFMSGRGEIVLTQPVLTGINQTAVAAASERYLAGDAATVESQDLSALIRTSIAGAQLPLRDLRLPVEIANGALKVASFKTDSAEATVVNRTTLDLVTLTMDSEWRITPGTKPLPAGRNRGPLPAVTVVYAAPIKRIARSEPRISAEELARELSVRRMERAVEELERLRKLDEERARQEAERRRALEEAQARSLEALQPQPPPGPVPTPTLPDAGAPQPQLLRPPVPVTPGLPIPLTPNLPGGSGEIGRDRRL